MTPAIASHVLLRTALIASLFAFSSAQALDLEGAKDWTNTEEVDAVLGTPVCRAQTVVAQTTVPVELSVVYPKDLTMVPVVYVKTMGLAAAESIAQIRFAKKEFQPMFLYKKSAAAGEPDIYWYAPKDLPRLVDMIAAAATLDVVLNPKAAQPVPVRISLKGSSATLKEVQKCALAKQLPTEFLKFLNTKVTIEGEIPSGMTAVELQALVQKSYRDYLSGKDLSAALSKLRTSMKPLTSKEAVALKDLSGKQATLDKTTKKLVDTQAELARLNAEIAQFEKELAQAKIDKPIAEQDLATKKAAYDPLKAQMAPFEKDVAEKTKALKSAKSAVARGQQRIADAQSNISYLKNRASSLRSAIPGLKSEVSSAEWAVSRARSELNSFSYSRERDSYMSRHGYSSAKSEYERHDREADRYESEARSAQSELSSAQSALSSCRASKPDANCSSQESAVNSAQSKYSSAQSSASSARSQASWAKSRMDSIEDSAERHARSMQDDLESTLRRRQSELSSAESELSSAENELSAIVNSRLPSAQNELARAKAALPGLQQTQADAEAALAVSKQAEADKRKAIGIDPVEQAYHAAIAHLEKIVKLIADRTAGIAKSQKAAAKLPPVIAKLTAQVAKETKIRDDSKAKLEPIQEALKPQRGEEAALVAKLDEAKASLAKGRVVYQAVYAQLSAVAFEESAAPLAMEAAEGIE